MSNVPMSRPQEMLACHDPFPLTRGGCIALQNGRVICGSAAGQFGYSDDGGMTWCEPYEGTYGDGTPAKVENLIELANGSLGGVELRSRPGAPVPIYETETLFTVSKDLGKTWSETTQMSEMRLRASAFCNALMRTSSGRIILPMQFGIGRDNWHKSGAPFLGGYVDGEFTTTDAHYYDPHFGACYVLYSDDEGRTWQPNRDGELFILLEPEGHMVGNWEPSVVETAPNRLLMFLRSKLGRVFQSWSADNGETWCYPQPTHLAASNSPNILTRLPATGHILAVWNQQSEQEIKEGYIRTRLSAAVSRNGGGVWEFFQNVESIHEQTHIEPGPIRITRPSARYAIQPGLPALENDASRVVPLNPKYGRWTNHVIRALEDRVLIIYGGRCKVLPLDWFYGGRDPHTQGPLLDKLETQCPPLFEFRTS